MNDRLELVAHRGSSYLAPENTLGALALGWQETHTCEIDVRPTLDGRLLVIHDASTLRTTGVELVVAQHALSDLQRLDAGSWKGPAWAGEKLPSLDEAIAALPADKCLLIEVKAGPQVVPELTRVIRASGKEMQIMLHSFDLATCAAARAAFPHLDVALLIAFEASPSTWPATLDRAIDDARDPSLTGINVNDVSFLSDAVPRIHAAGLTVRVWTIDDAADAVRLLAWSVDGLITNRPAWLRSQLDS